MKQNDMTADQAMMFVIELGFARLLKPRARPLHPAEPAPKKPRQVRLPKQWKGREAELHEALNESVVPALRAAMIEPCSTERRDELDLMVKFAKQIKCLIKPKLKALAPVPLQDAA